jgi:hypothetical protein
MRIRIPSLASVALAALALVAIGCGSDDDGPAGPNFNRVYTQVERLGNPLVSEVTVAKARHGLYNTGRPSTDAATFGPDLTAFVKTVAGREDAVAATLNAVLFPDMLIVQTNKAPNTAGWLTWALADGYGGRKLTDDVVDAGLAAIFGSLLSTKNVSPGLSTDNIDANDKPFLSTFPYLAAPATQ